MNYDFPQKRHWRRSLWNCIADRLQVQKRDALVFYLAGELDEDRTVATAKGFAGHNLVAIEHDKETAKALRAKGTLTLVGDAFEHLYAWNPSRRIDVCLLDLCGGLTAETAAKIEGVLALPHMRNAVVAVNLLRGRDPTGNRLRDALTSSQNAIAGRDFESRAVRMGLVSQEAFNAKVVKAFGGAPSKHRGALLQSLVIKTWAFHSALAFGAVDGRMRPTESAESLVQPAMMFVAEETAKAKFQTLSYRSTACQTFDSLVFVNSFPAALARHAVELRYEDDGARIAHCLTRHRPQQSAILAHRTRRLA